MGILNDDDRATISGTINWFAQSAYQKFERGVIEHGGTLTRKGGLLAEAEAECLDHIIYTRAIRHQLDGILDAITRGDLDIAKTSLKMLLRGSPKDTLPSSL